MTLAMSAKAAELKAAGENVISFGVGEPDFNTPAHIIQAAKDALDKGYTKYVAAAGLPALKKAVCKKFKEDNGLDYEPSQIIISNGAKHSIFNAVFATIDPGDEVYAGEVVGEHVHDNDLVVNVTKAKQLTNTRASGSDDKARIIPRTVLSLEEALEYIKEDELVEVTPKSMRMRKTILDHNERKKSQKG